MIKAKNYYIFNIQMQKELYVRAAPHKLRVNGFEWVRYISRLNKSLEKFRNLT